MTDRLDLANAIAAAGIERKAAETIASTIFDAIRENVATKADLQQAESALRTDMAGMQAELKADIAAVHAELKADVAALHTELRETEQRLEAQINRVVIRLGGLAVVLWGLLVAALHLWPPHG